MFINFDFIFGRDYIRLGWRKIRVNLAYDRVLGAYNIIQSDGINDEEKIKLSLAYFTKAKGLSLMDKAVLLEKIFAYLGQFYEGNKAVDGTGKGERALDFNVDSGLIYASFLAEYGIDLFEQKGKLHWFKFLMLLENISERAKLAQVIGYRIMSIPAENNYNREEVRRLRLLKNMYALNVGNNSGAKDLESCVAMLFRG